jgi:hypothetical protein
MVYEERFVQYALLKGYVHVYDEKAVCVRVAELQVIPAPKPFEPFQYVPSL